MLLPREEILAFNQLMERKLQNNGWKGDWGTCTTDFLFDKLVEKVKELKVRLEDETQTGLNIANEAANAANFAMMIADVVGGLEIPNPKMRYFRITYTAQGKNSSTLTKGDFGIIREIYPSKEYIWNVIKTKTGVSTFPEFTVFEFKNQADYINFDI